jgi:hypothetical protein
VKDLISGLIGNWAVHRLPAGLHHVAGEKGIWGSLELGSKKVFSEVTQNNNER